MKTTYHVLDNNRPATYHLFQEEIPKMKESFKKSWGTNVFDSFEEAHKYALAWCNDYVSGITLKRNVPHDYSGYGDTIEIREVKE